MAEVTDLDEFRRQKELTEIIPRLTAGSLDPTEPDELRRAEQSNADPRLYCRLLGIESSHIPLSGDLTQEQERDLESKLIQLECRLPIGVLDELQDQITSVSASYTKS